MIENPTYNDIINSINSNNIKIESNSTKIYNSLSFTTNILTSFAFTTNTNIEAGTTSLTTGTILFVYTPIIIQQEEQSSGE